MAGAGYKEIDFEATIERDFCESGGFTKGDPQAFDPVTGIWRLEFLDFVRSSQPALWAQLEKEHGARLEDGVIASLLKNLEGTSTLDVLRHGFKHFGKKITAAFFRPAHGLNPDVQRQYDANRLTVIRQVYPSPDTKESVDMVLAVNGLPVATLELKNPLTNQNTSHARKQYKDRDQRLTLFKFKRGAIVHFAVDPDTVSMATRLSGRSTRFLPFNRGDGGGAGNPTVEGEPYKTSYLWRGVLERHSLMDILGRFIHLQVEERRDSSGKTKKSENLIFPRYHQLDVVRRLIDNARQEGAGHHYLIQHSAGSGKSNSIAWTAHRLATLHDDQDARVFHSVVVVTDRRVLDKQLQDTIYQFEHRQGVVARIDVDSKQLAAELEKGTPIVITTLQKFPFVAQQVESLPDRRYAIIVDEAHSSQSGESARALREVLAGGTKKPESKVAEDTDPDYAQGQEEDAPTYEDEINRVMGSRGKQKNLSFFAFTATPKAKTLEVFGRPGPDGRPVPFHLYSMRQAIEEEFILDVLRNYTTYKTYYKLVQKGTEDRDVEKSEAAKALARFVSLHPHNIAQKTEVIVEHFRRHVMRKLDGRAKGMVVARSRLHAVRYKQSVDQYLADQGYSDMKALVAFSGTVKDPDTLADFTEVGMNEGVQERELPERFRQDECKLLLVAEKYQTGFDQPLLCVMYVDKKLSGVQAVQTLSRLNRTCLGKGETFVLDFVNETEEIQEAFQPFYEQTTVSEQADPYQLEQLARELDEGQVWQTSELEAFAKVFYRDKQKLTDREHEELHLHLQPSVDRFTHWDDEDAREKWRGKLQAFVRLYSFLSQVMPWTDRDLEVRFSFGRLLLRRLPRKEKDRFELDGDVDLHSYRLSRLGETDIHLEKNQAGEVKGPTEVGTRKAEDEKAPLSDIIQKLNERFGTNFTETDRLLFDQIVEDGSHLESIQQRAKVNSYENFSLSVRDPIRNMVMDRQEKNAELVSRYLDEADFQQLVFEHLARRMYDSARGDNERSSR